MAYASLVYNIKKENEKFWHTSFYNKCVQSSFPMETTSISKAVNVNILVDIKRSFFLLQQWSSGGVVVKLLTCGARGPGFDSPSRRYDLRD